MSIATSQLDTWRKQGATKASATTYASICQALGHDSLKKYDPSVYLQRSYANSTNIRGSSDVDVVIEMTATLYPDTSRLNSSEKATYVANRTVGTHDWKDFRRDVIAVLTDYYGSEIIRPGDKCVNVAKSSGRLDADVVVCARHRRYLSYKRPYGEYRDGIVFWTQKTNEKIVNFPKVHIQNGSNKNSRSSEWYKPSVRMFKNAVEKAVSDGFLQEHQAPSYFVECLVYNTPDAAFHSNSDQTFQEFLGWSSSTNLSKCTAGNGLTWLFGSESTQWTEADAQATIVALAKVWTD